MATDIELATNLIQAVNRQVLTALGFTEVAGKVPDLENYPTGSINETPVILTWPMDGSWWQKGHGYKIDERTFLLICFSESLGQNLIPQRAVQSVRILQALRNQYVTPSTIPLDFGTPSGYQITVASRDDNRQSDGGLVSNLEMGGVPYSGFVIRLLVRTQWI